MRVMRTLVLAAALSWGGLAQAQEREFTPGPVIADYGAVAEVPGAEPLPEDARFSVAFDIAEAAEDGAVSRRLESAVRFINMHARAGVAAENVRVAIVVHGGAHRDLLARSADGGDNPNAGLIAALIAQGAEIYLCGQTAAYYGVDAEDLLPGVRMSLSAMTAHALLQQRGYTLNPF